MPRRWSYPKTIAIFTDGTGNSASSVFKTNVWRLYQALDLSSSSGDDLGQVAYYQDGVGTSTVKPLALIGGAFGWGLKRNVIDAYIYLCEKYMPGDQIFLFGFSRGGFTARVLLGLILSEGLLTHRSTIELHRYAPDAYRRYRRSFNATAPLVKFFRAVRDWAILIRRASLNQPIYHPEKNERVTVRFIGVWDTVSAYGLPIAELTRGIDQYIWPLSLPDHVLPQGAEIARQALALDDEREAFHPLPWDEIGSAEPSRILQVWFSGMHADVGGGYPQEGLALFPLAWMMRQASEAGIKFKPQAIEDIERWLFASAPMHDSRRLFGAYYRYQPRRLGAFVDPPDEDTLSMRNTLLEGRGLLKDIKVHWSVMARIKSLPDQYAPIVLPKDFTILNDDGTTESQRLTEDYGEEEIWNLVWWKRAVYFWTVAITITILVYPLFAEPVTACEGPLCLLIPVVAGVANLLPGGLRYWALGLANEPAIMALLVVLPLLLVWSRHLRRQIHDVMRRRWGYDDFWGGSEEPGAVSMLEKVLNWIAKIIPDFRAYLSIAAWLRHNKVYQRALQFVRWKLLPLVFGMSTILVGTAAILFCLALGVLRIQVAYQERSGALCSETTLPLALAGLTKLQQEFKTSSPCWPTGITVERGKWYRVVFEVVEPWRVGNAYANPLGLESPPGTWIQSIADTLGRRSMRGRLFQPLIRISTSQALIPWYSRRIFDVDLQVLNMSFVMGQTFVGAFKAGTSGELSIFVNERMISADGVTVDLYKDNRGSAIVSIEEF